MNSENANKTLTKRQIKAMKKICKCRHDLHSDKIEYHEECPTLRFFLEEVDEHIATNNLPNFQGDELSSIRHSIDRILLLIEVEDQPEFLVIREISRHREQINTLIERYLKRIDEEYGTSFKPVGLDRKLYNSNRRVDKDLGRIY